MEKTNIYIVVSNSISSFSSHENVLGFFLNKDDAEFYQYQFENNRDPNASPLLFSSHLSVRQIPALSLKKDDKEYKKFVEKKIHDIRTKIGDKNACKDKDESALRKLGEEQKHYESLLK